MEKAEYRPLIIPKLTWNKKTLTKKYGELVAQPLEPGFGVTLGNALRRVLLGGVEGCAVTSVIINKVNNEFSMVPGVVEDTMQILLNIKGIVIRSKDGKAGTMRLKVSGEETAHASHMTGDANLEVINPDHVIAHVAPDGELEIEFFIEPGRGYQQAQWPAGKALQEDGRIYLDAMFSPIRKVTFDVEKTRVGKDIDYDKLTLQIHTNGAEDPLAVLHYAVSVLRNLLEHFLLSTEIPFNEISAQPEQEGEQEPEQKFDQLGLKGVSVDVLLKPVEELELSVRAHNCLVQAGIKRIIDLVNINEEDTLKIKNFGRKSLNEVKDALRGFGLSFGMNIKEDDIKKLIKE